MPVDKVDNQRVPILEENAGELQMCSSARPVNAIWSRRVVHLNEKCFRSVAARKNLCDCAYVSFNCRGISSPNGNVKTRREPRAASNVLSVFVGTAHARAGLRSLAMCRPGPSRGPKAFDFNSDYPRVRAGPVSNWTWSPSLSSSNVPSKSSRR